jgi:hypothetical protein
MLIQVPETADKPTAPTRRPRPTSGPAETNMNRPLTRTRDLARGGLRAVARARAARVPPAHGRPRGAAVLQSLSRRARPEVRAGGRGARPTYPQ